jgi:N utilization substance protein B
MRKRTKAREYALQMLYQLDIRHAEAPDILREFWAAQEAPEEVRAFATRLVEGTAARFEEIDGLIRAHAANWDLKRMAVVDRNILRLGVCELLQMDDVPPNVCIDEAIELAKRFGDAESAKFINGILDAIYKRSTRKSTPADTQAT